MSRRSGRAPRRVRRAGSSAARRLWELCNRLYLVGVPKPYPLLIRSPTWVRPCKDSTQRPTAHLLVLLPRLSAGAVRPAVLAALRASGALNARLRRAEGPDNAERGAQ